MKITGLSLILLTALLGVGPPISAQSTQAQNSDISLAESKKISPYPPKNVEVEFTDSRAVVKWTKVPTERVTGYDIYRMVDDGKWEKVGHTKELQFVDKARPKGKITYAVASVDYNDNQSKPREATVATSK